MANGQYEAVLQPPRGLLLDAGTVAELSDGHLLEQFAAHRDELGEVAFEALVRRHGPMVLRVCQQILGDRHTAEDVFQATFLILARRAGSIRQPELLGHWLHGVALRTAREARMRDDRRRRRESPAAEGIVAEPIDRTGRPELTLACCEEFEALHEEVSRLPERYRIPVVLCDLEGMTYQEAARRLRCPLGTIGVRLRRARERLRERLTRRGMAPTAGLLGTLLCADRASAWMPPVLVDSTVQAAMGFAASKAAATGLVSASVASLTAAVLRTMALARLKVAMSVAMAVGITAAMGWLSIHRESRVQVAPVQAEFRPMDVPPTPTNSATPDRGDDSKPVDVAPSRPGPTAPELGKPRPWDESPLPGQSAATAIAGRAILSPTLGDRPRVSATTTDGSFSSARHRDERSKGATDPKIKPATAQATPNARRSILGDQARGEVLFSKEWVPNDPMSHGGDGLGPVYNETSCIACHGLGAPGGAGPESKNVVLVTATPAGCGPSQSLDQVFPGLRGSRSTVLHHFSTDPGYATWRERLADPNGKKAKAAQKPGEDVVASRIRAAREQTIPGRRHRDRPAVPQSMNGFNLNLAERNTPPLFGAGRIDEIPSDLLVAIAAAQSDEVRGRVGRTREGRVGRFGWKAQLPSLHEFVRVACANELGLEVPGHSQAVSPIAPKKKPKGLDLTEADCDALVAYVRALPAPVVVDPTGPQGSQDMREGRRHFTAAGCATCHTPSLGEVRGIYSDLLLHDLGQSLSDSGSTYGIDGPDTPEGPKPREWRTPPLWGYRDSGPYLHDGRAKTLEEAVALHEGQAASSTHRFFELNSQERAQVEVFLKSLVAPSAATSGVMLAAEMEARIDKEEHREAESLVRQRRDQAVARDEQNWREAQRRRRAEEAAKRAHAQFPLAENLERMGKTTGALDFYTKIAREAAGTEEGRLAAARIAALSSRKESP